LEAWRRTWDTRGSKDMARGAALGEVGEEGRWIWIGCVCGYGSPYSTALAGRVL
jgi:hypothetical protein